MAVKFLELFKNPSIKKTFEFMGDNPDSAVYVACAIALFKAGFRPLFTMTDKKSDPETKKYTAIREALTEGIAIPVYFAIPKLSEKLIVGTFFKNADEITKKAVKANVKFIGVLASTAIIPAICNVLQPPIMAAYQRKSEAKNAVAKAPVVQPVGKTSFTGKPLQQKNYNSVSYGMRVGN